MSKKIVPNKNVDTFLNFKPTQKQLMVKAEFWDIVGENPALNPATMAKSAILKLMNYSELEKWLNDAAFQAWFFKQNHVKTKIQAAAESAIDKLVELTQADYHDDSKLANTVLKACEAILKYGGFEPPKSRIVEIADKHIQNMNKEELEAYLADKMNKKQICE